MALRAAVLGTGSWAGKVHLPALAAHPEVELIGVWGRRPAVTAARAAEFGIRAYESLDSLFSAVDLVSIAVTPDVQPGLAAAAAHSGTHLILEKPAGTDAAACRALASVVESAGIQASVFLSRLWDPARQAWLERVAASRWHSLQYRWVSAGMRPESPGATGWRSSAGPLLDVGPHVVGVAEHLAGRIVSTQANAPSEGRVELRLVHEGGCVTNANIDLMAAVTSTREDLLLIGGDGEQRYSNPTAVDFVGAYKAMLDDLLSRISGTQVASARATASSLQAAVPMADVLDAARVQLRSQGIRT